MPARTPADIGHDIAAAQQRIVDLKSELADVPPQVLILESRTCRDSITFKQGFGGKFNIVSSYPMGNSFTDEDTARLRAWLNHYYPEEASA